MEVLIYSKVDQDIKIFWYEAWGWKYLQLIIFVISSGAKCQKVIEINNICLVVIAY